MARPLIAPVARLWEIATLDSLGRIQVRIPREWLEKATARILSAPLLTHDRHIVDSGLVTTLS